jgi:hypothetical protein
MFKKIKIILAKYLYNLFYKEQWSVFIRDENFKVLRKFIPPSDRFWADPILHRTTTGFVLFFEELKYKDGKGFLSFITLDHQLNQLSYCADILSKSFHLSFPFTFKHKDSWYMIPETNRMRSIELYTAVSFPSQWNKVKNLMDNVVASDSVVIFRDNLWWLFTTLQAKESNCSNLNNIHLFYSSDLIAGEWTSHPMNPVKKSLQARSAGQIFEKNGQLIRPSQNSDPYYGHSVILNEITSLTTLDYSERPIKQFNSDMEHQIGVHTYNVCDSYIVTDALFRYNRFSFNK